MTALDELSLEAIRAACGAFARAKVEDFNYDYPPPAARLALEARRFEEKLGMAAFWDRTSFVEYDSPEWRALCRQRGRQMPMVDQAGKTGWYVPKDEVAELPPQLVENERALLEHRDPRAVQMLPQLRQMGEK